MPMGKASTRKECAITPPPSSAESGRSHRSRLAEKETHSLLRLLAHPEEAPRDNALPYETNGYRRSIPENPKFREQRMAAYGE